MFATTAVATNMTIAPTALPRMRKPRSPIDRLMAWPTNNNQQYVLCRHV
jgi:hypothetical protein